MAQLTQATPRNYWISPNALFIQLNAMGTPDYIQASCTSGAQILVYVKDIIPYDAGHNYQRWPLQASPTVFNSHTEKYVYVAVPRSDSSQKEAVVVFPSEEIDIYGKNENAEQIGDEKYYYIFLQGIITSSGDNGTTPRDWKENCRIATGYLSSDEAVSAGPNDSEWFSFSPVDNFTTFLKDLTMKAGTKFRELFAKAVTIVSGGSITFEGQHTSLSGVADETTAAEAVDRIVTPKYMDDHALSSVHDDIANGLITFLQGLQVGSSFVSGLLGTGGVFRKDADGKTYIEVDKIYARVKAIFDNVEIRNFQHTSGNRIVSVAGMNIVRVENVDANGNVIGNNDNIGAITTAYRCYFRGKDGDNICTNDFVVGDLAFCSRTNIDENLTHKRYWRAVVRKSSEVDVNGNHWIDLSVDDCEKDSDIPSVGDDVSQLGNKTKTERQGVIIEMSSGAEAPCYQIFQGINDYTLEKKCMIDLGYNSTTGRAKMNVYGDAFIGDIDGNSFVRYDSLGKTLEIKAKIDAKSTIGDRDIDAYIRDNTLSSDDVKNLINNSEIIGSLQNQIDGAIETWYYEGKPTLENLPAQGWTDDETKNKHIGDLYYDMASGKGYRFLKDSTNTYTWAIITDEDITKALALAGEKKRIFGTTPTPPYDVNDLWVYAVYPSDGSKYNKEILRCITAKSAGEKFSIDDWALASDYATNTKVAQLDYLKDALKNDTVVDGGLILSTLIALRDKNKNIQSGINGAVQDAKYEGGGIAAWYGGEMGDIEDKSNYPNVTNWAKSLLRFDGSGYLANGNVSWGPTGKVSIKDLSALINTDKTDILNVLSSISSMFSTRVKESEVLILPQLRFGELFINRLNTADTNLNNNDVVLTQGELKDRFVTIDWFNKVFSVVDDKKSDLPVNGNISAGASIHAKMSLWSDGGLSALGNSDTTGGGGGLMGSIVPYAKAIALTVQNEGSEIASAWSVKMLYDKIENVDVSGQLTSYLTKQEAQTLYQPVGNYLTSHQSLANYYNKTQIDNSLAGKSPTSHTHSVIINGSTKTISATGGTAVNLGTYLTSHQSLAAYLTSSAAESTYLKLSGGTLTGTLTANKGLVVQGRVYGKGDDEGIIINASNNGYAGVVLGSHDSNRGILYFNTDSNQYFLRTVLNGVTKSVLIPYQQGTMALTSQIPTNNNQLTNGAGYITSSGSCAYATNADTVDGVHVIYDGSIPNSNCLAAWENATTIRCLSPKSLKLSKFDDDILSGKYLSLTGGTLTGNLNLGSNTLFAKDISIEAEGINWNFSNGNKIKLLSYNGSAEATGAPGKWYSGVSFMTHYVGFQLLSYGGGNEALLFRKMQDNGVWHSWHNIYHEGHKPTKADVGLGNVDNTADANKSVSYAVTSGVANAVAWDNVSGRPTSMPASDVYAWAKAATKPNYTYDEILVKGLVNVEGFTRVVIALCEVLESNAYTGTFSSGEILYYRFNGVIPIEYARVNFIDSYRFNYDAYYSLETSTENESKDKPISSNHNSTGFRKCTFVYNGKHYAGIEVYFSQAASYYWRGYSHGHTVFGVIVEQGGTVKNEEIYNSLSYNRQDRSGISFGNVRANSFAKKDSSDSYVLLGGGGHSLISSLSVATAAKLQTARTIWGQSFDGTSDITGPFQYESVHISNVNEIWSTGPLRLQNGARTTGDVVIAHNHGGRVGIGTYSPRRKFHVEGTSYFTDDMLLESSYFKTFRISRTNVGNAFLGVNSNGLYIYSNVTGVGEGEMKFKGSVGLGIDCTPQYKLHVNGDMATTGRAIVGSIVIGDITISYDKANKGLRIAGGGLYTDSYLSSLGVDASTALSVKKWADSIQITTESDAELATAYSIGNLYRLINSNQKTITESLNQSVSALQGRCTSLEQRVSALEKKVNK